MKLLILSSLLWWTMPVFSQEYQGSRFNDVWSQIKSDPYATLPQETVSLAKFFQHMRNFLLEASERTLNDRADLLPYFTKLLHPNGICLKGRWVITEPNPYSGYFAQGSEAVIIVRASTALDHTKTGSNRAFGFTGKLYPTTQEDHEQPLKTANFFTIEDLGGTRKPHYLDAENTNDIIKISPTLTALLNSPIGLAAAFAFSQADHSSVTTALIRELYPIGELGLEEGQAAFSPVWLRVKGNAAMPRILATDFREELDIRHYPDGIKFDIEVASQGERLGLKKWQYLGYILLDDSVVSESCDHRLHFSHPRSRP